MANFNIKWSEKKNDDWIVAQLHENIVSEGTITGKDYKDVSINRKSKKGDIFPNFDEIMTGQDVEGELWISDAGKNYLFAPRKKLEKPNFMKKNIEAVMDKKNESISKFQGQKEESIALMSAQRDAVLIVTTITLGEETDEEVKQRIIKWRNWFLSNDFRKDIPPF